MINFTQWLKSLDDDILVDIYGIDFLIDLRLNKIPDNYFLEKLNKLTVLPLSAIKEKYLL